MIARDPAKRKAALEEGEEILRQECISHNYLWFYRNAMDSSLESGEWDEVERYATALETYTRSEPLPWSDFFIARGRALAAFGRGQRDAEIIDRLRQLRDQAQGAGFGVPLPALQATLTSS